MFLAIALAGCSPAPTNVRASGVGEVVVIQPEYGAVTIRHEPIPEYGMGAMTMEFTTDNPALLKDVAVGDQVTFELKAPTEIDKITVVQKE